MLYDCFAMFIADGFRFGLLERVLRLWLILTRVRAAEAERTARCRSFVACHESLPVWLPSMQASNERSRRVRCDWDVARPDRQFYDAPNIGRPHSRVRFAPDRVRTHKYSVPMFFDLRGIKISSNGDSRSAS
jgi:hypothetical protein